MSVELGFTLTTPRCRLRVPTEADIPHVFSATRFSGFNDGMLWEPPGTVGELRGPLERSLAAWRAGTVYTFTIETAAETHALGARSEFVGRVSLRKTEAAEEDCVWNLGFWTHPERQSQGYMTEAATAVLEFGFGRLHAARITACHAHWNRASRRVLERLGLSFTHHLPQGFKKNGVWVAEDCLSLTRADWASRRAFQVRRER